MKTLTLISLVLLFTVGAVGDQTPLCVPGTLQSYINLGSAGCSVGILTFSSFSYSEELDEYHSYPPLQAGAVPASSVDVSVIGSGFDVGLGFQGYWSVSGDADPGGRDESLTYTLTSTDPGAAIVASASTFDVNGEFADLGGNTITPRTGFSGGGGVTNSGGFGGGYAGGSADSVGPDETVVASGGGGDLSLASGDQASLNAYLVAESGSVGGGQLNSMQQSFLVDGPEPPTWILTGLGLVGLAVIGWFGKAARPEKRTM